MSRETKQFFLKDGERLDDLQLKGLMIIQNEEDFCFGMDAVLLSSFASVKEGECVLDLGCGNGILPLLLSGKTPGKMFTGLEIQPEMVSMAQRSVEGNEMTGRIRIVEGDLRECSRLFPAASFDVVVSNPPYMTQNHGLTNPGSSRAIARHELLCTFEDVAAAAARMLRSGGRFYLVHRPNRLPELITTLRGAHLEPKRMRLVYPFVDREPNLVLLECARGGRAYMKADPPLIVYSAPGVYTPELLRIYGMEPEDHASRDA